MAVASSSVGRSAPSGAASNVALTLGIFALVGFGVACGVALAMGEIQALYVTLAALACIAILTDFRIGAVLLIVLLPVSNATMFPHQLMGIPGLNPINVLILGTLGAFVLRGHLQNMRALVAPRLVWLYVVPIMIGGLLGMGHVDDIHPFFYESGGVEYDTPFAFLRDMAIKPLLLVVAAVLIAAAVVRSDKPERFIAAIAISACALALLQFAFIAVSGAELGSLALRRSRTFFAELGIHANTLGRLFVTAYALLLFVWWETKRPGAKLWLTVTLAILGLGIVLTFSRNAFLGFVVVNALFVLWRINAKKLALALGGLAMLAAVAPGYLWTRITFGLDSGDTNVVSAGRTEGIWAPLLPEIWNSPFWGDGLGSTMWATPMLNGAMEVVTHPHNAFLEAVLDMGFIGLVLLCLYYLHVWRGLRALGSNAYLTPEMRGFFQGACAALIAFGVACLTGGSLRPEPENTFLWVAIGMMYGVAARRPTA